MFHLFHPSIYLQICTVEIKAAAPKYGGGGGYSGGGYSGGYARTY
jgi:hypothetical protein